MHIHVLSINNVKSNHNKLAYFIIFHYDMSQTLDSVFILSDHASLQTCIHKILNKIHLIIYDLDINNKNEKRQRLKYIVILLLRTLIFTDTMK